MLGLRLNIMDILYKEDEALRPRSNTWPGLVTTNSVTEKQNPDQSEMRKNGCRKNPWGNLSYADLISHAISSAPENRMTLAQIYEWLINNVPYFREKMDNASSAGWKNSVRHNLSLHNRFKRLQNEVMGKSSWWIINPDAPNARTRRRTASTENGKTKGRGKVCALRSECPTQSPNADPQEKVQVYSAVEETHHRECLQPPLEFRRRAYSENSPNNSVTYRGSDLIKNELSVRDLIRRFNPNLGTDDSLEDEVFGVQITTNEDERIFDEDQLQTLQDIEEIIDMDLHSGDGRTYKVHNEEMKPNKKILAVTAFLMGR